MYTCHSLASVAAYLEQFCHVEQQASISPESYPCLRNLRTLYVPLSLSLVGCTTELLQQLFSCSEHSLPHAEPLLNPSCQLQNCWNFSFGYEHSKTRRLPDGFCTCHVSVNYPFSLVHAFSHDRWVNATSDFPDPLIVKDRHG